MRIFDAGIELFLQRGDADDDEEHRCAGPNVARDTLMHPQQGTGADALDPPSPASDGTATDVTMQRNRCLKPSKTKSINAPNSSRPRP